MKISNVKIVNHNLTINNADLEITNGIITKITPKKGLGQKILIPGFIDSHIHGYKGFEVIDSQESLQKIGHELLKIGVTSFVPTVMTNQWTTIKSSLKMIAQVAKINQQIVGIHLEGPFISQFKKGAHEAKYLVKPTRLKIEELVIASDKLLNKITFAPEEASNLSAVMQAMKQNNIIASIGHTNGHSAVIKQAIAQGASSATHLWNAMTGVVNRDPGTVAIILNREQIMAEIICDLVHIDQETLILTLRAKTPQQLIVVSDAILPSGLKNGEYKANGFSVIKKGKLITLKNSDTIAGSSSSMYEGFKNLMKITDNNDQLLTLNDIVAMTSFNVANHLKLPNIGQIAEQKCADLIILNDQYDIIEVISKGKKVNLG